MVKSKATELEKLDLKIAVLRDTIKSLEDEVPIEGQKWQSGMIRYYSSNLARLEELRNGIRRTK